MRIPRSPLFGVAFAVIAFAPRGVTAQQCQPAQVVVDISVGDKSTPQAGEIPHTYITNGGDPFRCQTEGSGWGAVTLTANCPGVNTVTTYSVLSYLGRADTVNCAMVNGCVKCAQSHVSAPLFAHYGNFVGFVEVLPSRRTYPSGSIYTTDGQNSCPYGPSYTPNDFYNCAYRNGPAFVANDWGVGVHGDGHSPGSVELTLVGPNNVQHTATAFSSKATEVDFIDWVGEPVECSETQPGVQAPPESCSKPVSLTSGNVYFRQTDATIMALGGGLDFTRTYNSVNRGGGIPGIFGPGWQHTYEQNLSFPEAGVIKLRRGNGRPIYFSDQDGDLRYDPTVPYALESWIQKQTDGSYVRYLRKGGSEAYDASGRLQRLTDAFGNETNLAYDGTGLLTTIAAPGGRALTLTYTGGRVSTLSGPEGPIATYTYVSGQLSGVQYADVAASGYTFTYDSATGAIATVSDLTGRVLETHTYDGSGRGQTSEISGGQEKFTLTYLPNQTQVTTVDGTTTYDFGTFWGQQRVTKVTGPCDSCADGSETQQWTYDHYGRVASYTDADGLLTTYTYDSTTGDLVSKTETKGAKTRTTSYTYDASGRVLTVTAPDRGTVTYAQSAAGPTSIRDAIGRTTTVTYTATGKVETVTKPSLKPPTTLGYQQGTGDLTSVTDGLQEITTYGYDTLGWRTLTTDPHLAGETANTTSYAYDARRHITRTTFPDGQHIDYTYDRGGRRETMTDQLNHTTTYAYDAYARLATITDANTPPGITRYGYDAMSRLSSITDARGKQTTFHYDAFGRVDQVTYPGSPVAVERFTYFPTGRVKTRTDRKGVVTTYTYDELGRLSQRSPSDGSGTFASFNYDLADRVVASTGGGTGGSPQRLNWVYDLAGQLTSESNSANPSQVSYVYDASGNRTELRLGGSLILGYAYDNVDRLETITRGNDIFTFAYDAASRRTTLSFPNGTTTTYDYDPKSRLTAIETTRPGVPNGVTLTSSTYTYDAADNRLTKDGDFNESYAYDPLYRITQAARNGTISESYTYDAVGNRLSALGSSPWSYDDRNELLSYPTTTIQYDLNGNQTQRTDATGTWTYEWNAEKQLTRVLKNGVEQVRYTYDPLGRRRQKIAGGVTNTYIYDGADVLRVTSSTGANTTYLHGPNIDETLATEDAAGNRTYLHVDGLGSVVRSTDSAGNKIGTQKYNSFGVLESGTASTAFTGREWDAEAGLYYYRARYYDPKIGRFISEDPIGFKGGINFYAYVRNNPVNRVDPSGLDEKCYWFGVSVTAAVGIGIQVSVEDGICKDCHKTTKKRRVCICSTLGGGFSAGPGFETGDSGPSSESWQIATPVASFSGDPTSAFPSGISTSGVGAFYSWCRCEVKDGW
jgi:RHS repeat-associated protein